MGVKKFKVAIVGVTGMVGRTFVDILNEKDLPIEDYYIFASKRSAGKKITIKGKEYVVEELTENSFDRGIDIALFSAGGEISKIYAPIAASKGCLVVDNSSYWRMDSEVPLVVPEVNPEDIKNSKKGIIANPNCSTIQAMVALKPLHDAFGIKRVVYSTYQAVSGAGVAGWTDLEEGLKGAEPKKFSKQIAGNCLPHIDSFLDTGYTKEEQKMVDETRKILHAPELRITATTVRVPVYNGHSESINIEFNKPFEMSEIFDALKNAKGIKLMDDFANLVYPTALDATGKDDVYVGRIRRDFSVDNGINIWVVADNIRKGAALNTVQIAETIMCGTNE